MMQVGHELHRAQQDVLELALADEVRGSGSRRMLDRRVDHLDAGGAGQLAQLGERGLGLARGSCPCRPRRPGWPARARRCGAAREARANSSSSASGPASAS